MGTLMEDKATMNSSRKLRLKWDDFGNNTIVTFRDLWLDTDLSDVTLVGEGNTHISIHKIILAASSPVFCEMLKQNKHPHPLIYMRGIKAKYLVTIVDFIYHGETEIFQNDLDEFLNIAEELQLKGLRAGRNVDNKQEYIETASSSPQTLSMEHNQKLLIDTNVDDSLTTGDSSIKLERNVDIDTQDYTTKRVENVMTIEQSKDSTLLDQQILSIMERTDNGWKCNMCNKVSQKKNHIKVHIEAIHIEATPHICYDCGKLSKTRDTLRMHRSRFHFNKRENLKISSSSQTLLDQQISSIMEQTDEYMETSSSPQALPMEQDQKLATVTTLYDSKNTEDSTKKLDENVNVKTHDFKTNSIENILTIEQRKDSEFLDQQILSIMELTDDGWSCNLCSKVSKHKSQIKDHIEAIHIESAPHPCEDCGKISKTRNTLRLHRSRIHFK